MLRRSSLRESMFLVEDPVRLLTGARSHASGLQRTIGVAAAHLRVGGLLPPSRESYSVTNIDWIPAFLPPSWDWQMIRQVPSCFVLVNQPRTGSAAKDRHASWIITAIILS